MQKCNWKYIVSRVDCIQKSSLMNVLDKEIDKLTPRYDSVGMDAVVEKVVISFSFVSMSDKLAEEDGQCSLWTPNIDVDSNIKKQTELYFDIEIQDYIACMGVGGPFGKPVEYSILASNNGFNWKIKEVKRVN